MLIKKFKNENISLKLEKTDHPALDSIMDSDDLFMADLYIHQSRSGWRYLIDTNAQKAYSLDDYGYDTLEELITGKTARVYPMNEDDAVELYNEFNEQ